MNVGKSSSTRDTQNPFPATAVSKLSGMDQDYVSIQTDATKEATAITKAYLAAATESNGGEAGQVVAVVGEYGTGKTHIALQILNDIREDKDTQTEAFYLDAPADTFLALYKERFFPQLKRTDVIDRVREYFSDIIADDLERSKLTLGAAKALRERTISPLETIEKFGLMDSQYREVLIKQLEKVTEQADFATAFSLMLRPEFEYAVWEWFAGNQPDQSLVDRGISEALNDDKSALESIGVLAFLFGRQSWRFVLIIDEMEKVLSPSSKAKSDETILALKKLMEAIGRTNSMLILVGLPDFLDALPDDARQRLSSTIRPSNLTAKNVEDYISASKKRYSQGRGLKPFNRDVVTYVSEIAGGNARKVVRLCFHVYRQATEAGANATQAMVRAIARDQFEVSTTEDVSKEILRVIDANGWLHETEKAVGSGKKKTTIDVWLPVGENDEGCAIFVQNSILDSTTSKDLINSAKAVTVSASDPHKPTVLIVNGHVAENLKGELDDAFGRVLVNSIRSFTEDLDAILKGMVRRIEERSDKEAISKVLERVEQISRQLGSLRQEFIDRLEHLSEASRTEFLVERAVLGAFRSIGENSKSVTLDNRRAEEVFERVEYLIERVRSFLDRFGRSDRMQFDMLNLVERSKQIVLDFKRDISRFEKERLFSNSPGKLQPELEGIHRTIGDVCRRYDEIIRNLNERRSDLRELRYLAKELDAGPDFFELAEELPDRLFRLGENVYETYI